MFHYWRVKTYRSWDAQWIETLNFRISDIVQQSKLKKTVAKKNMRSCNPNGPENKHAWNQKVYHYFLLFQKECRRMFAPILNKPMESPKVSSFDCCWASSLQFQPGWVINNHLRRFPQENTVGNRFERLVTVWCFQPVTPVRLWVKPCNFVPCMPSPHIFQLCICFDSSPRKKENKLSSSKFNHHPVFRMEHQNPDVPRCCNIYPLKKIWPSFVCKSSQQ